MVVINEQYVRGYLLKFGVEDPAQEEVHNILGVMQKYQNNRWWESDDPVFLAYHQVRERILIIPMGIYYSGANKLCGRSVFSHDLFGQHPDFISEIEAGMKRLNQGWKVSVEGREALEQDSANRLEEITKTAGKFLCKI